LLSIEEFISNIHAHAITQNEITICEVDEEIINFLATKRICLQSKEIKLTVRRYKHITRDFKKHKKSAISDTVILNLYKYLTQPFSVYFDNNEKHKNIMYINKIENQYFKIIVNLETNIVTAGLIKEENLKDKFLERIK